jgi:hypothetical protein
MATAQPWRSYRADTAVSSMLPYQRTGLQRGQRDAQPRLLDEGPRVTVTPMPGWLLLERGPLDIQVEVDRRSYVPTGWSMATATRLAEWPAVL